MSKACCKRVCTARYTFALLASISLGLVYAFRLLGSVALLFMVDTVAVLRKSPVPHECDRPISRRVPDGPFTESHLMQGVMLASYYMGFLVSQIPLAIFAERVSAKCVMATAVTGNTVCAFLSPLCARYLPFEYFCGLRAVQGFLSGGAVPAANVMITKWCPPEERHLMYGVVYTGPGLGVVFGTGLPGLIVWCGASWDWMYYAPAILALIITVMWIVFVGETPLNAHFITEQERLFIMEATDTFPETVEEPHKYPWNPSCKSCKFWTIAFSHFCSNVGWYFIITTAPSFMKWIMNRQAMQITMMLAAAYLSSFIFSLDLSIIGMVVLEESKISVTAYRKIANSICSLIPAVVFMVLPFTDCQTNIASILFIIAIVAIGAMSSGIIPNCIDIAPNFAGMLIVNSNTFATIPGIVVPILIGLEMDHHGDMHQYLFTFFLIGGLYVLMFLFYTIFATAEIQPWNFLFGDDKS